MTTFWPSAFSISAAVTRVTWSVDPPAAHGTMIVIGFVGFHCCADAAGATVSAEQRGDSGDQQRAFAAIHAFLRC